MDILKLSNTRPQNGVNKCVLTKGFITLEFYNICPEIELLLCGLDFI